MIYASAAAVLIALLAWDYGRRYLSATTDDFNGLEQRCVEHLAFARDQVDAYDARCAAFERRLSDVEGRPAQSVDLSKHDAAVLNLAKQLQELAVHVDEECKRERASRAGMLAGPQGRRLIG